MEVRTGRQTGLSNLTDYLTGEDSFAIRHHREGEVAVQRPDVAVDDLDHVQTRTAWIEPNTDGSAHRRPDGGAHGRSQVYASVHVPGGAVRIEWLEEQGGAAKRLRHDRARNYRRERKLLVTRSP